MDNDNQQAKQRSSSPRFPSIALPSAIDKARIIWDREGKHPARLATLAAHWGLSEKSSALRGQLAALGYFGLLDQVGGSGSGDYRLTELAIKILAGDEEERKTGLREAALQPKIYRRLWERFDRKLPSDANLESRLLIDFGVNRASVRGFIKDIRATFALAEVENEVDTDGHDEEHEEERQPPSSKAVQHQQLRGQPMTSDARYFTIPLQVGDALIPLNMSPTDWEIFINTLKVWKGRLTAAATPTPAANAVLDELSEKDISDAASAPSVPDVENTEQVNER